MKYQKICLLFLLFLQFSYQYCHYSQNPSLQGDNTCACTVGFYNDNQKCIQCPNNSSHLPGLFSNTISDCNNCIFGKQYMQQKGTDTQNAVCVQCPNNSTNGGSVEDTVKDESRCSQCVDGYFKTADAVAASADNSAKAATCQRCPNNTSRIGYMQGTNCDFCKVGIYGTVKQGGNLVCQLCPNNTSNYYQPMDAPTGQITDCKVCAKGYYNTEPLFYKPPKFQKCPGLSTTQQLSASSIQQCSCALNQYIVTKSTSTTVAVCQSCPNGSTRIYDVNVAGDESQCDYCSAGYYLITPYQDSDGQNPAKSANCQICPNKSYSNAGISTSVSVCSMCQQNFYMQTASDGTNSVICQPCPDNTGTLDPVNTVGDAKQCTVCKAGYFMTLPYQDGQTVTCKQCPSGSTTTPGINTVCYCFDQNAFWSTDTSSCQCKPGSIGTPATSLTTQGCTLYPAGQFQQGGNCVPCHAGTFSGSDGSTSCTSCTSGQFAAGTGNKSCSTCPGSLSTSLPDFSGCKCIDTSSTFLTDNCVYPQGYSGSPSNSAGTQGCKPCLAGQYSNSTTSGACIPCLKGTYSIGTGNSDCLKCTQGQFVSSTESTACTNCGPGSTNKNDFSDCQCYDSNASQTDGYAGSPKVSSSSQIGCTACIAGQEVNTISGQCTPCAVGSFSSGSANQSCTTCTSGQFASGQGNTSCSTCQNCSSSLDDFSGCKCIDVNAIMIKNQFICKLGYGGTPSIIVGQTGCTACCAGNFSDASTSGQCIACPAGTYSSSNGSQVCQTCSEGEYASGTENTYCLSCGSTLTNNADFSGCQCIDPNSNQPNSNASCICNPGYIGSPATSKSSLSVCASCPAGQFIDSGKCSPCPAGTYSSGTANSKCTSLEAGQYAVGTGNTSFKRCSPGSTNTVDFSGCKCYDKNAEAWTASSNLCQCKAKYYGEASKATDTQDSVCVICPNNLTSIAGVAKTQKDCQSPSQDNQYSFSQKIKISLIFLMIILM
ncbi:hypothetical protein ABPG72_020846 [Tetrahymena utriculariae]